MSEATSLDRDKNSSTGGPDPDVKAKTSSNGNGISENRGPVIENGGAGRHNEYVACRE